MKVGDSDIIKTIHHCISGFVSLLGFRRNIHYSSNSIIPIDDVESDDGVTQALSVDDSRGEAMDEFDNFDTSIDSYNALNSNDLLVAYNVAVTIDETSEFGRVNVMQSAFNREECAINSSSNSSDSLNIGISINLPSQNYPYHYMHSLPASLIENYSSSGHFEHYFEPWPFQPDISDYSF